MPSDYTRSLVFLHGEIKTPPFTVVARYEAGALLRRLQNGETIGMPSVRPMPSIGAGCYELRVRDEKANWRIIVRVDTNAIVVVEVFTKTTPKTPKHVIETCQLRLKRYDKR